jgi:dihydroneopterin aldolase
VSAVVREYRIRLEGIRFRGTHGVSDSERDLPQDFLVSLELWLPSSVLPPTDQLKAVFDYDRVATLVVEEGTKQAYRLLETLAQRLLERLLSDTPATRASVSIQKSRPPTRASVDAVSVELIATRE